MFGLDLFIFGIWIILCAVAVLQFNTYPFFAILFGIIFPGVYILIRLLHKGKQNENEKN